MNTVFVILHYLATRDTLEAVESIKKYEPMAQIVIVDNASGNGSLEKLKKKFAGDDKVDIIVSPENAGFARGNNLGIVYAKEQYLPDFIILTNNDVLLLESISSIIEKEYENSHFAVLGPMIYTADGRCNDNPGVDKPMTLLEINHAIHGLRRKYWFVKLHLGLLLYILRKAKRILLHKQEIDMRKDYLVRKENVQLHGSFMVLSPKFFEIYQGLFNGTFLNMEEDILFWQLQKNGMKTIYLPEIHIFHKEDSASKKVWPKERKRAMAKIKNCLDSAKAFRELMKENERKEIK